MQVRRFGRVARAATALAALAVVALPFPVAAAPTEVATVDEGWFDVSGLPREAPPCPVPGLCPELPDVSTEQDGTLRVEVRAGRTTAFTAFALDRLALPAGATVRSGTLVLPVAGQEEGTQAAALADLRVCILASPAVPARGAPANQAPQYDCSVSSQAHYGDEEAVFTADLAPFVAAWDAGTPPFGLAVVPGEAAAETLQTATVVFHARDRTGDDTRPIVALVEVVVDAVPPPEEDVGTAAPAPAPATTTGPAFRSAPLDVPDAAPDAAPAPEVAPSAPVDVPDAAASGPQLTPVAAGPSDPFLTSYPVAWLLPLLALGVASALGGSLSAPMAVTASDRSLLGDLLLGRGDVTAGTASTHPHREGTP